MTQRTENQSLVVMACTTLSRLLGIVRARVIASAFGSSMVGDVINFTFNIPNNLRKLFAEGAMNAAFIPHFSVAVGEGKKEEAENLMNLLFSWQLLLFLLLDLFSLRYASFILASFSDFSQEQILLGAKLLPFFMLFLSTISLGTIFSGMLQVHSRFLASSFAPLIFSITTILGILLFHEEKGAMSMAYSCALGGFLQLLFWYFWLRRLGYHVRITFSWKGTPFPSVLRHWCVVVCSSLLAVVGQQVAYSFASLLEEGSVTAYSNATIFWQTPYGIFFTAISTVYFPLMSKAFSHQEWDSLRRQTGKGVEYLFTLLLPSSILLYFLSNPMVSAILQTGAFTLDATLKTASVVRVYAIGMVFIATFGLLQRLFFSIGRYRKALAASAIQTLCDIIFSYIGIHCGLGVIALPLGGILSYLVSLCYEVWELRDIYRIAQDFMLATSFLKVFLANIPLLILGFLFLKGNFTYWQSGSSLKSFFITCFFGIVGLAAVLCSYSLCKISFLESFHKNKE